MAPITATTTGVTPQVIDDPELVDLITRLSGFRSSGTGAADSTSNKKINLDSLISELSKYKSWRFQEQADLYEWKEVVDILDEVLGNYISTYPGLVLVGNSTDESSSSKTSTKVTTAKTINEVKAVPPQITSNICVILQFFSSLLRNSNVSKQIFNSVDHLSDLLGASDDTVASLAIEVFSSYLIPPLSHRQQTSDHIHYNSLQHAVQMSNKVHNKIMSLARGWGSRGSGLGLFICTTADDSTSGQGHLPAHAGELCFEYYNSKNELQHISLSKSQIVLDEKEERIRSTSELYFDCLSQIENTSTGENDDNDKLFSLLSQIRLARNFHTNASRVVSVRNRLRALTCALHAHPSQDILAGYFHAQPELCVEIVDLLRPTVSSQNVSCQQKQISSISAATTTGAPKMKQQDKDSYSSFATTDTSIPFDVKLAALDALTALVSRRDGSTGGISNIARQVNVLQELGVGKGQYWGFLPTLIRYSLSSLYVNNFVKGSDNKNQETKSAESEKEVDAETDHGIELGLLFIEATKPPPEEPQFQEEKALDFIDAVLCLTFSVVSLPSGTASLTDCGLIPALVSTISLHSSTPSSTANKKDTYSEFIFKYIISQAVQIIEGSIATHNSALSAFHELGGIDLLVKMLDEEITFIKSRSPGGSRVFDVCVADESSSNHEEMTSLSSNHRPMQAARRVLLFSIVNCLTVVLQQHEPTSATTTTISSGGNQLRKPELTNSLIDIFDHVSSYGAALVALASQLLSDVMNNDPQVVHHVHSSGIAKSFLNMLVFDPDSESRKQKKVPLSSDLVMALPNVISALCLTEKGAKAVKEFNPFPSLLSIFYNRDYVMPLNSCLLNDMASIFGTALDELMRHVPSVRKIGIDAIVNAIQRIVQIGKSLQEKEKSSTKSVGKELEDERTCLMQYAYNICQLLESVVHCEDHVGPFVEAKGFEPLIELFPLLMSSNEQFLAHVSCLSNPATSHITHSTTTKVITSVIRSIAQQFSSHLLIRKVVSCIDVSLTSLEQKQKELRILGNSSSVENNISAENILNAVPDVPLHDSEISNNLSRDISSYFHSVITTDWLMNILSTIIRAACNKGNADSWISSPNRDQWKKELSSDSFSGMMKRLCTLHHSAIMEVCRVRVESTYEDQLLEKPPSIYRLRIVCNEGAVVRDGIEIDSCNNIGSLQMGEIVDAYDRCINSSGVMRYNTSRGWVSEQTRGHDREPIAEVISISDEEPTENNLLKDEKNKRIECSVPNLRSVCASMLCRLQNSQKIFFSCLSRAIIHGVRAGASSRTGLSNPGVHAGAMINYVTCHIRQGLDAVKDKLSKMEEPDDSELALYLSNIIELLHVCICDEKRERRILNIPLLLSVSALDSVLDDEGQGSLPVSGIFGAIRFVLKFNLNEMAKFSSSENHRDILINLLKEPPSTFHEKAISSSFKNQRLSKAAAASLPPTLHFLRRLCSRSLLVESQLSSLLNRMKYTDLTNILGEDAVKHYTVQDKNEKEFFNIGKFARELHCMVSRVTCELWCDERLVCAPAHVVHPIVTLVSDCLDCMEAAVKPLPVTSGTIAAASARESGSRSSSGAMRWASLSAGPSRDGNGDMQDRVRVLRDISASMRALFSHGGGPSPPGGPGDGEGPDHPPFPPGVFPFGPSSRAPFEPSETVIERMMEMGFGRDHALEALEITESNRLEVAMDYALNHPPPSPSTIERRRTQREERRRRRLNIMQNLRQQFSAHQQESADSNPSGGNGNSSSNSNDNNTDNSAQTGASSDSKMDIDVGDCDDKSDEEKKQKELTEAEMKALRLKEIEALAITRAENCLSKFKDQIRPIALNLIESTYSLPSPSPEESMTYDGYGNGESEDLTTVICYFLSVVCERHPKDRSPLLDDLLKRIKGLVSSEGHVKSDREFASLCHASVILLRALPRTRSLALLHGMINILLGCIRQHLSSKEKKWPIWLPSVLLFLDVLAQPTAAEIDLFEDKNLSKRSELYRAIQTRKKFQAQFSQAGEEIFALLDGKPPTNTHGQAKHRKKKRDKQQNITELSVEKVENKTTSSRKESSEEPSADKKSASGENVEKKKNNVFSLVPPFSSLIPQEETDVCISLCLRLIYYRPSSKVDSSSDASLMPPPGVVHACLLLIARLTRSHRVASYFLRVGGAESLLSLPSQCRFLGKTSLMGNIFRHVLEDESTLRLSMETEMRSIMTKLHKQQNRGSSSTSGAQVKASLSSFIKGTLPLLCRDSIVFLKAAATSVKFSSSGSSNKVVILLTNEERNKNTKLIIDYFGNNMTSLVTTSAHQNQSKPSTKGNKNQIFTPPLKRSRCEKPRSNSDGKISSKKSQRRSKTPKGTRRDKNGMIQTSNFITVNGSPANHIVSLLLTDLIRLVGDENNKSFLRLHEYVDLLSGLVLVVPACAAVIHRYRFPSSKNNPLAHIKHALSEGETPPSTAVSYFLHVLLPQERTGSKDKSERKATLLKVKLAQSTARLLITLCARAGEGRRRVIFELVGALNGTSNGNKNGMWALRSWGELCIGLAAPRSSNISQDRDSALSFEVLKLMLEFGMGHAIVNGIAQIKLHHPLASHVASTLLRPLEVLTRGSVSAQVEKLFLAEMEKEREKVTNPKRNNIENNKKISRALTVGPSQRPESTFADDAMLEPGFDPDTAERADRARMNDHNLRLLAGEFGEGEDVEMEVHDLPNLDNDTSVDTEDDESEDSEDEEMMDIEMEDVEQDELSFSQNSEVSGEHDDMSGTSTSSDGNDGPNDSDSDSNPDTDDSGSESEDIDPVSRFMNEAPEENVDEPEDGDENNDDSMELEENFGWVGEEDVDFFANENSPEDGEEPNSEEVEEGWTRVDPGGPGFSGVFIDTRGGNPSGSRGSRRGIFIDRHGPGEGGSATASAAFGSIRDILQGAQMETLAEIEDHFNIRIMGSNTSAGGPIRDSDNVSAPSSSLNTRNRGSVNSVPNINQSGPFSSTIESNPYRISSRQNENSSMEYAYGAAISRDEAIRTLQEENTLDSQLAPHSHHVIDSQLFPGGPASAMHTRSQQALHPLLGDIDLPPVSSIYSISRPHGIREVIQRSDIIDSRSSSTRDMTLDNFLSSGGFPPGANIIRFSNSPNVTTFIQRFSSSRSGPSSGSNANGENSAIEARWTDDGQPLDDTSREFATAFERAFSETISNENESRNREESTELGANRTSASPNNGSRATLSSNSDQQRQISTSNASGSETAGGSAGVQPMDTSESSTNNNPSGELNPSNATDNSEDSRDIPTSEEQAPLLQNESSETASSSASSSSENNNNNNNSSNAASNGNSEEISSEGEGVASSLAATLRLSPRSEEDVSSTAAVAPTVRSTASASSTQENEAVRSPAPATGENLDTEQNSNQENAPPMETSTDSNGTDQNEETNTTEETISEPNENGLRCPPGMDLEVFNSLPVEMQQEVVEQHRSTQSVAAQLDSSSSLDPEALAALPEEMRREVIAQEQQERMMREPPANPSNAEEMDNASFIASLSPELRGEILMTADENVLNSLPPHIIAEARVLRERATSQHRRLYDMAGVMASRESSTGRASSSATVTGRNSANSQQGGAQQASSSAATRLLSENLTSIKRRNRSGKMRLELDRGDLIYIPASSKLSLGPLLTPYSLKAFLSLMYLLSPVRPSRLIQKVFQNFCSNPEERASILVTVLSLLKNQPDAALYGINMIKSENPLHPSSYTPSQESNEFPPQTLIGTAPDVIDHDQNGFSMFRRRPGSAAVAAVAASLPSGARGSKHDEMLPPVVARRLVEVLYSLSKNSPRISLAMVECIPAEVNTEFNYPGITLSCLESLIDLLNSPLYSKSSTNLEHILSLMESIVAPLSFVPRDGDREIEISKKDIDAASAAGKEWVTVPRPQIASHRLKLLCSVLRLETCKDSSFQRVNNIAKRLSRVDANRSCILSELASVAQGLGLDSLRDLKLLGIKLNDAVKIHNDQLDKNEKAKEPLSSLSSSRKAKNSGSNGIAGSAVTLSTSSSEHKLLRVLQTLQSLCIENSDESSSERRRSQNQPTTVTHEMVTLLKSIDLDPLWDELTSCLRVVSVLEGVSKDEKDDDSDNVDMASVENNDKAKKKLQNSAAGLLSRFLPTIEAFFVVNASSREDNTKSSKNEPQSDEKKDDGLTLVGGQRLLKFSAENKVLLNALLRANPSLLEKGLRAMVQVRSCRQFLDFDVKRQWFKTQLRRLRQQASRRYGSLRLNIRRKHVFEDTYHQLGHRNAEEMKGRLHITFQNEEGVDAGGLSREFFAILSKEIFNPNYALFTSTEDGCTFQPNPNSSINPEHLSYFRFVGRIVGKAVVDGFLMDAHFTRSLYKHMLGVKPTHHDMQAIDPDFYKNLQMILDYNLDDIGLDHLTFSTEDHSFGRSQTIDLVKNGRNIVVTDSDKEKYVDLVCQHRMTTSIQKQIKAYLEGFYELVKPSLISIFTAKELELLISGMPDIDMHDLRKNTDYQGYKSSDEQIRWFWNIMFTLTRSEKAAFLQFVTGSAKVPLEGFSQLQGMRGTQKFSIHKAGGSNGALMSAHTCFNALDLPVYKSEEEMRKKLLLAINEGGGGFLFA